MTGYVKGLFAKLFGPDGDRVAKSDLVGEAIPADLWSRDWRHVYHPTDGLTVQRLADVCRRADDGDPRAWLEMAEEAEEKDGHYAAVLSTRKRAVMQLPITVEAASDAPAHLEHATFVREWVATGCLQNAVLHALDAISKSYSVLEIDWQTDRDRFWPKRLIHRSPTWFAPDRVDGETIQLLEGVTRLPLAPHKFLVHTHRYKSGALIRSGLGRVALWSWMFKMFTARDWALFVQRYGQPIRIGRYNDSTSKEDKATLWRAVRDIAGDMAAIIHESTKVDLVESKLSGQSSELFEKRCAYYDQQLSKIVLGQTTTTDAISGGHAVAQEHRQVQQDIERSDGIALATSANAQIVPQMVAFNYGPQDAYPRLVIGRPDELPVQQLADALDKLIDKGLTVDADEIRARLTLKKPEAGAEILGGRAAAAETPPATTGLARALHARGLVEDDQVVGRLTDRLQRDAAGALQGLTETVRSALEEASSLPDALARLEKLDLNSRDLAEAMRRGMALAHLAGQAALIDDLDGEA